MKILILAMAATVGLAVGGCQKAEERTPAAAGGARGRYVGVGIYSPGQMWSQLARAPAAGTDPASASLDDDEQVIVVLDSTTGELRQCGNLSGHCIGLNPWSKPLAEGQRLPSRLLKHAQELQAEQDAQATGGRPVRVPQLKRIPTTPPPAPAGSRTASGPAAA
jgi:hypothetical protein